MEQSLLDRVLDNVNTLYDEELEEIRLTRKSRIFLELLNDISTLYKVEVAPYKEIENPDKLLPNIFYDGYKGTQPDLNMTQENTKISIYKDHKEFGKFRNMESRLLVFTEEYDHSIQVAEYELNFTARGQKPSLMRLSKYVLKDYMIEDLLEYMDAVPEGTGAVKSFSGKCYYFEDNIKDIISERDIVDYVNGYDNRLKKEINDMITNSVSILHDIEDKITKDPGNTRKYLLDLRDKLNKKLV